MPLATLTLPGRVEFVRPATTFLVQAARAVHAPRSGDPMLEVAIGEAVANAVRHGAAGGADGTITCQLDVQRGALVIRVLDGRDAFELPDRDLPEVSREQLEQLPASGYGVPIMHAVFSSVRVISEQGRFGVEMRLE